MKTIDYTPDRVKKELSEHIPVHIHVGDPELRIKRTDAHQLEHLRRAALAYIRYLENKNDENGPLTQGRIREEQLKKVWMPTENVHICKACKTKYTKGGGIPKDIREGEEK